MTTKIAMSHKERKKRVVATFKKHRKGLKSRDLLNAAFKQIPFLKALHARGVTLQPISKEIVRRYELWLALLESLEKEEKEKKGDEEAKGRSGEVHRRE